MGTHLELVTSQDTNKMEKLKSYLLDHNISSTVAMRVQRNAQHALEEQKKNASENSIELLTLVSTPLRMELHFEVHMPVLSSHPFFENYSMVSPMMMRRVCHSAISHLKLSK